ncbi:MAG: hypothetical protein K9N46_03725 [Candidatus Marinimicrobia bacterium]|nr:hypothetical protein [Candidatus Neomarinimicrobiota bacterium]MCF7829671.1 hypothetical protein [Candidatus Neomarinimicrobiota bacterium]MCF7879831.1 hypothetical protein [Candidatus Neomarinimicrobiota bacterium]
MSKLKRLSLHVFTLSLVLGGLLTLAGCDGTASTNSLEPLPYPNQRPDYAVQTFFLDSDSMASLQPELVLQFRGSDTQGRYIMEMEIHIDIENQTSTDYTFAPGRATIYSFYSDPSIATVGLSPIGTTTLEHTVDGNSFATLKYTNDPIDGDIIYNYQDAEFFAVFSIEINGNEEIFTTQVTQPSG